MQLDVVNNQNEKVGAVDVRDEVFGGKVNTSLVWESVVHENAAKRRGTHMTKNRALVAGSGKKPWRQKGTGRARVGSVRNPIWRHGGTVQGPVPRDYEWGFPKRMRRNAIKSALAQKLRDGKVVCVEGFDLETHRTKDLEAALAKGLKVEGKTLLVSDREADNLERAARNNPRLTAVRALGMSIVDLLDHETLVVSEPALRQLAEVLAR